MKTPFSRLTLLGLHRSPWLRSAVAALALIACSTAHTGNETTAPSSNKLDGSPYESAVLADGPVAYWRLGESTGNQAVDSTGNGHDGNIQGSVGFGAQGAIVNDPDTAYDFKQGGHVEIPNSSAVETTQSIAVELWVNLATPNATGALFQRSDDTACGGRGCWGAELLLNGDGTLSFWITVPSGGGFPWQSFSLPSPVLAPGTWHHVVGQFTGSEMQLWVDGTSAGSRAASGPLRTGPSVTYIAGGRWVAGSSSGFPGDLDEVAIYAAPLSASSIQNHFALGQSGGGCTPACGANQACQGSQCACNPGFAHCNGDTTAGCEVDTTSDPANCGTCGSACAPGQTCTNSQCVPPPPSCDLSSLLQLRAFIPQMLPCNQDDAPGDNTCNASPPGFPEPGIMDNDRFHGDHRDHSADFNASHRQRGIIAVPDLIAGGCPSQLPDPSSDCGDSHKCAASCDSNGCSYTAQTATAPTHVNTFLQGCSQDGTDYHAIYQVDSGYPFNPLSPHIFDQIGYTVTADSLSDPNNPGGPPFPGVAVQVDVQHTGFPAHELVVQDSTGATNLVYTYDPTDCGPGLNNLGPMNMSQVHTTVSFHLWCENGSVVFAQP